MNLANYLHLFTCYLVGSYGLCKNLAYKSHARMHKTREKSTDACNHDLTDAFAVSFRFRFWWLVYQRIMSEAKKCPKKGKTLAEKQSFEGNCKILRKTFKPRVPSSDIPASQKGVYSGFHPPIISETRAPYNYCEKKKKTASDASN